MRNFGALLTNEWIKLYKKKSFYVYFALMAIFIGICGFFTHRYPMEGLNSALDFVAVYGSMMGAGQILPMIAIIAIANVVPSEFRMGTIKLLLIRAQSRSKILASKYAVTLLFSLVLIVAMLAMAFIAGIIVFGFGGGDAKTWSLIGENTLYMVVYTVAFVTLTFMVGVVTKSSGATVGIAMFCIMAGGILSMLVNRYAFIKYTLFPNVDLSVYMNGGTMPQGMTLPFSVSVIAVYIVVFLLASFFIFRKRDVS
ncbi:ABC transporter permease [Paenibacillus paeoniae]|uniref:ABC transporter permease n=1 Tax=Paenibacillus paeoniae TaxID=2292705 RepID=A0A371PIQ4_9BACL|nr:ABC transporter permease [Paenibacillus paeoniae]REK76120.1 ABC transporter permease [Paenibacillus paeoniae]